MNANDVQVVVIIRPRNIDFHVKRKPGDFAAMVRGVTADLTDSLDRITTRDGQALFPDVKVATIVGFATELIVGPGKVGVVCGERRCHLKATSSFQSH